MVSEMFEDLSAALGVIKADVTNLSVMLNLIVRVMGNQYNKVKVLKPKPFYGVRDVKVLDKFIFYLEQYFQATNIMGKEAKVTLVVGGDPST